MYTTARIIVAFVKLLLSWDRCSRWSLLSGGRRLRGAAAFGTLCVNYFFSVYQGNGSSMARASGLCAKGCGLFSCLEWFDYSLLTVADLVADNSLHFFFFPHRFTVSLRLQQEVSNNDLSWTVFNLRSGVLVCLFVFFLFVGGVGGGGERTPDHMNQLPRLARNSVVRVRHPN